VRTIIIGDIHGYYGSLKTLLTQINPKPGQDRLIMLGDLFDRGPESREVFLTVKKLSELFQEDFILIRGNHEDYLLQSALSPRQMAIWEKVGRQATVRSFQLSGERMEDTIPWLKEHVSLFYRSDSLQCVHAGLLIEPIEANDLFTIVHDHEMARQNRYKGRITITGHIALKKAAWFAGDEETCVELTDHVTYELPRTGILCIDTGCGKGGRLTAMILNNQSYQLISVPEIYQHDRE